MAKDDQGPDPANLGCVTYNRATAVPTYHPKDCPTTLAVNDPKRPFGRSWPACGCPEGNMPKPRLVAPNGVDGPFGCVTYRETSGNVIPTYHPGATCPKPRAMLMGEIRVRLNTLPSCDCREGDYPPVDAGIDWGAWAAKQMVLTAPEVSSGHVVGSSATMNPRLGGPLTVEHGFATAMQVKALEDRVRSMDQVGAELVREVRRIQSQGTDAVVPARRVLVEGHDHFLDTRLMMISAWWGEARTRLVALEAIVRSVGADSILSRDLKAETVGELLEAVRSLPGLQERLRTVERQIQGRTLHPTPYPWIEGLRQEITALKADVFDRAHGPSGYHQALQRQGERHAALNKRFESLESDIGSRIHGMGGYQARLDRHAEFQGETSRRLALMEQEPLLAMQAAESAHRRMDDLFREVQALKIMPVLPAAPQPFVPMAGMAVRILPSGTQGIALQPVTNVVTDATMFGEPRFARIPIENAWLIQTTAERPVVVSAACLVADLPNRQPTLASIPVRVWSRIVIALVALIAMAWIAWVGVGPTPEKP